MQTTATYVRRTTKKTFSASGGTAVRYFPDTGQMISVDRSARVGFETQLGGRNRFSASQSVQYSPFHQFGASLGGPSGFAGESPLSNADGATAVGQTFYDLGTAIGLDRTYRRASLSASYSTRINLYSNEEQTLTAHRAGVGLRFTLARYISLLIGTASNFGQTGQSAARTRTQDIDLGLDYNRPLSFSRNTTLRFKTGTAVITRRGTAQDPMELGGRFRLIGSVAAEQTLGRNWQARAGFDRNMQYLDAFPDPFYTTGLLASLTGKVGRRLDLRWQGDYSSGKAVEPEAIELGKSFEGGRSMFRLNFAASRQLQFYAEHHYSENHLSVGALQSLPPGLIPRRYGRAVRVGMTLWAPFVH
jgi:hypothetical protein